MKPSDKPADRPTVPEVAAKLREYRKLPDRFMGGCVHICVDDPNYAQHYADWCLENAAEWAGDEHKEADVEIATLVAALTTTQRRKLAKLNTYPEWRSQNGADAA